METPDSTQSLRRPYIVLLDIMVSTSRVRSDKWDLTDPYREPKTRLPVLSHLLIHLLNQNLPDEMSSGPLSPPSSPSKFGSRNSLDFWYGYG